MAKREVVVIGAGVIGLTVSNRLQESGAFDVTIVAEHIPQHKSVGQRESTGWASPWAGAHWRAWAGDKDTLLQDMEQTRPTALWYATKVDDVQELRKSELPEGVAYGLKYSTLLINVPHYLSYLKAQFESLGGRVIQSRLDHIREALLFAQTRTDPPLVINCTALGSRSLGGVNDQNMYPIRGQTLVFGYVIPRGDGTVVIGGTADRGSWDASAHDETTQAILEKALALESDLVPGSSGLSFEQRTELLRRSIVSVNVGFRPARVGGVRLEVEDFGGAFTAIHCYGHAGFGYQSSAGFARQVLQIANGLTRPSDCPRL
ncbi:nucleotide-binding domain-containing protein [Linderina pennispora]|uniref:Nucleotide-binding domain-containing protein n=1 Tax=Linderina pennispora TaxID=61395 RepID=A0A1Y1WHM9_9FUNG|nr:nucleotide-binding domain-containing protein [Linderina pennispora]ORX73080.1 nucleotide-binding domain-containing protein [Linderina pennispora]